MIGPLFKKIFGSKSIREVKKLIPVVEQVNAEEEKLQKLTDEQLKAKTQEFQERLKNGETTDDILIEAYAVVKNACRRMKDAKFEIEVTGNTVVWDMVPYDVQIIGSIAIHRGGIAEMQTGEGKTLVGVMPLYLNALTGRNCQLVTVNDYLARRDSEWVGAVLRWLGLTVGCIQNQMRPAERREMYACDVTYGTNSEFGFDYLRDMGMATNKDALVQRDHFFVIIDEIDSILIDEARTPLIISGPVAVSTHKYDKLKPDVERLFKKQLTLVNQLAQEAKATLSNDDCSDDDYDDAILKLLRIKMGMPKHKQLMRFMEDGAIRRDVEKRDMEMHAQTNRGMLEDFKDTLYFSIDEKHHDADLSEMGRTALRPSNPDAFVLPDLATSYGEIDKDDSLSDEEKAERREAVQKFFDEQSETIHNISQLLRAYCLFELDQQYIVVENKVVIVDEHTGRPMPGRRFSDGLHQALEAKEGVDIERETQTMASITIQNYFRMYDKLAGMTGTAETEASEFKDIYNLEVYVIPTNRPCLREDHDDRVFKTRREKYQALLEEIREVHASGRPILVGTVTVEESELVSRMLKGAKIIHTVLNARQNQAEAEIVARAGQKGALTIATNMAGRGTDIRLGEGVVEIGGLHVIGSSRHDSRRIDRQLRGRCSRQGDPGSTRFYISLEDDLMRLFGSDRIASILEKMGLEEGEELSHPWLNKSLGNAQRRVEQQHYAARKHVLQYDDVSNKQRVAIYGSRRDILFAEDTREMLFEFVDTAVYEQVQTVSYERAVDDQNYDQEALLVWLKNTFPIGFDAEALKIEGAWDTEKLVQVIVKRVAEVYEAKEKGEDPEALRWLERQIMLDAHDRLWQKHLYAMDNLRDEIRMHSFAQRDPLVEFKKESYYIFNDLITRINDEVCANMFRSATSLQAFQNMMAAMPKSAVHAVFGQFDQSVEGGQNAAQAAAEPTTVGTAAGGGQPVGTDGEVPMQPQRRKRKPVTVRRDQPKVGRNDPCPCGSGKKFKSCHGRQ
jgi:preprotein translocase subunit SecA